MNSIWYYKNVITLQVEEEYIILKFKLGVSTGDLLYVMINIDFLLWNQHQKYSIVLGKTKNNTSIVLKRGNTIIYQDLTPYITLFALFKIHT